jgi:hypothetical protein
MKKRTDPSSVRFDIDKLEFIKKREKLTSSQQVIDFLMNDYWWKWKVPIPTHKEAQPIHLKEDNATTSFEPIKTGKSFGEYMKDKKELESEDDYIKFCEKIDADPYLSEKQKNFIKTVQA